MRNWVIVLVIIGVLFAVCVAAELLVLFRCHRPELSRTDHVSISSNRDATATLPSLDTNSSEEFFEVPMLADPTAVVRHNSTSEEEVAINLISWGWQAKGYEDNSTIKGSKKSAEMTIKGILIHIRRNVHFNFFAGKEDESRIRALFSRFRSPRHRVTFSFLPFDVPKLEKYLKAVGHAPSHRTGPAGNIKFFYPLLQLNETKAIMLDTDVIVMSDIGRLWDYFLTFKKDQLFAFAPQWKTVHPIKDNQFNAGVALLHLQRMREVGWLNLSKTAIEVWDKNPARNPKCCAHGDQSVFHMIRALQPSSIGYLPRWWNINKCHQYQGMSTPGKGPAGSFAGIVHLGCCKMCNEKKIGRWINAWKYIESYEWGWLDEGRKEQNVFELPFHRN